MTKGRFGPAVGVARADVPRDRRYDRPAVSRVGDETFGSRVEFGKGVPDAPALPAPGRTRPGPGRPDRRAGRPARSAQAEPGPAPLPRLPDEGPDEGRR